MFTRFVGYTIFGSGICGCTHYYTTEVTQFWSPALGCVVSMIIGAAILAYTDYRTSI